MGLCKGSWEATRVQKQQKDFDMLGWTLIFLDHRAVGGGVGIHRHRRGGGGNSQSPFRHFFDLIPRFLGRASGALTVWGMDAERRKAEKLTEDNEIMKNGALILLALAVATLVTGCNQSTSANNPPPARGPNSSMSLTNAWQQTNTTATNAWANTKEAAREAWVDIKEKLSLTQDYTYDKKDEYVAKARADLDALDQKIGELSDRAAQATESAKEDAQVKLQDVHNKRAALDDKLNNVKNSTEADWNDAKTAFNNSYNEVQNTIKQTWQWLSDKLSS